MHTSLNKITAITHYSLHAATFTQSDKALCLYLLLPCPAGSHLDWTLIQWNTCMIRSLTHLDCKWDGTHTAAVLQSLYTWGQWQLEFLQLTTLKALPVISCMAKTLHYKHHFLWLLKDKFTHIWKVSFHLLNPMPKKSQVKFHSLSGASRQNILLHNWGSWGLVLEHKKWRDLKFTWKDITLLSREYTCFRQGFQASVGSPEIWIMRAICMEPFCVF